MAGFEEGPGRGDSGLPEIIERKTEPLKPTDRLAPARQAYRPATRAPSDVVNKILECAATRAGEDRRVLTELIERCKAYDDGCAILYKARAGCDSRLSPSKARELDEAIAAWQPPPDADERKAAAHASRAGADVPPELVDRILKCAGPAGGDRDTLAELIERCNAYDNGRATLIKARAYCDSRRNPLKAGDLDGAITDWQPPRHSAEPIAGTPEAPARAPAGEDFAPFPGIQAAVAAKSTPTRPGFWGRLFGGHRRLGRACGEDRPLPTGGPAPGQTARFSTAFMDGYARHYGRVASSKDPELIRFHDRYLSAETAAGLAGEASEQMSLSHADGLEHFFSRVAGNALYIISTLPMSYGKARDYFQRTYGGYVEFIAGLFSLTQQEDWVICHLVYCHGDPSNPSAWGLNWSLIRPHVPDPSQFPALFAVDLMTDAERNLTFRQKTLREPSKASRAPSNPSLWSKGRPNPVARIVIRANGGVRYLCPTCSEPVTLEDSRIPYPAGRIVACRCRSISHVPAYYKTKADSSGPAIAAGVRVPIGDLSKWVLGHPCFATPDAKLRSDVEFHGSYGLWAACAACHYQYATTVLAAFPLLPGPTHIFNARSDKSARDFEALTNTKQCPNCGATELLAIMVDVPQYVRNAVNAERTKRGI
jgi:hypothetical protein